MHSSLISGAAVLAATSIMLNLVRADNCAAGAAEVQGNWYCQAVSTIQYSGFAGSGSYSKVTAMDSTTGACQSSAQAYSGSLAPLDEEISLHFRGPLQLKQFAVYVPSSSSSKAKRSSHSKRHGHAHFHEHNKEVRELQAKAEKENEKRANWPDIWVTATIDGQVVSWLNDWHPGATAVAGNAVANSVRASVTAAATSHTTMITQVVTSSASSSTTSTTTSTTSSTTSASSSTGSGSSTGYGSSAWTQSAYYDSSSGTASGVVFLNHYGGQGSGTFDYVFGNSLSYASDDGTCGSASPTVLADITIDSNKELVIMSDTSCDDGECGFYRPGTVAYHGFGGSQKIFLLEFSMPDDGTTGYNMNMPAIWILNAQIPRTLQYGSTECSCWSSGCGEMDLFEVLDSGSSRCKSTYHGSYSGGDSDYFARPVNGTIKAAVVMNDDTVTIKVLDDNFDFTTGLSSHTVAQLQSSSWSNLADSAVSLFALSS